MSLLMKIRKSSLSPLSIFSFQSFFTTLPHFSGEKKETSSFIHPTAVVHPNAIIGQPGEECFLDVGNNNEIREHASIHRSSKSSDRTVSQDVPKYTMVAGEGAKLRGLNLEGLRRRGFTVSEIKSLRMAYRKIFMRVDANNVGFEECLTEVEQDENLSKVPAVCSMVQSIRDSLAENRRGICKFRQWSRL